MSKLMSSIFAKATRFFAGTGIGRPPLVQKIYRFLYCHVIGKSAPLPPLLVNVQGHRMYVKATTISFAPSRIRSGFHEKYETELFKGIVKKGMVVVDIGANIGYYTLIAAGLVGENGKVFAFEPEPESYALLVRNIEANGYKNVVPVQKAVSNKVGTTRLFLSPDGNTSWHRIYDAHDGWNFIEIETVTLDEFFKDKEDRIDVIKMDVEGAEMAVLQGMSQILKRNDNLKIFTEFLPIHLEKFGSSPEGYLSQLIKHGFKLYAIDEQKEQIRPVDVDSPTQTRVGPNLLCLKEEYEKSSLTTSFTKASKGEPGG